MAGRGNIDFHIEADKLLLSLSRSSRFGISVAIKRGMADYLFLLKKEALKNIIKDNTGYPDFEDNIYGRRKTIIQKTNPTKLTSRSGRLMAGLKEGKNDFSVFEDLQKKRSTTSASEYKSLFGVISGGGNNSAKNPANEFHAYWSTFIRDDSAMLFRWRSMFPKGKKRDYEKGDRSKARAKKMLAIRFQHEKGVRGTSRPFFYPAYLSTKNRLNEFVRAQLDKELKTI